MCAGRGSGAGAARRGREGGEKGGAKRYPRGSGAAGCLDPFPPLPSRAQLPCCTAALRQRHFPRQPSCQAVPGQGAHGVPPHRCPPSASLQALGLTPPRLRARLLLPASPDRWTGPAPLAPPAHRPLVGNVWRDGTPATALPRLCRTLHLPVAATFISCPRSSHLPAPKPPLRPAPAALSLRPPPASLAASGTVGARMGAQGVPSPGFGLPGSSWALWPLCHCRPPSLLPSLCQQWMVMPDAEHQHSPSCCRHVAWGSGRQHVPAGTESTELGGTPALPKP